jgi:hypothetical protein
MTSSLMDWDGSASARSSRSPDPPALGAPQTFAEPMEVFDAPPNGKYICVYCVRISLTCVDVAGGEDMQVLAAGSPVTFSPGLEDCSSIDPRVEHVIEFVRSTITLAFPATTNRINALIEAVLYIEKMKGYPHYQVCPSKKLLEHHLLTFNLSAYHGLAEPDKDYEESPR